MTESKSSEKRDRSTNGSKDLSRSFDLSILIRNCYSDDPIKFCYTSKVVGEIIYLLGQYRSRLLTGPSNRKATTPNLYLSDFTNFITYLYE